MARRRGGGVGGGGARGRLREGRTSPVPLPSTAEQQEENNNVSSGMITGYTPTTYSQTVSSQDYGSTPDYETPEEALENYMSLYNRVQAQMAQTNSVYNYNNYDPSDRDWETV